MTEPNENENLETPASLGYSMPAEWAPHVATWIAWPHNREDWPGKFGPIPWVYTEIVKNLTPFESVNILVNGGRAKRQVSNRLERAGVDLDRVCLLYTSPSPRDRG